MLLREFTLGIFRYGVVRMNSPMCGSNVKRCTPSPFTASTRSHREPYLGEQDGSWHKIWIRIFIRPQKTKATRGNECHKRSQSRHHFVGRKPNRMPQESDNDKQKTSMRTRDRMQCARKLAHCAAKRANHEQRSKSTEKKSRSTVRCRPDIA